MRYLYFVLLKDIERWYEGYGIVAVHYLKKWQTAVDI